MGLLARTPNSVTIIGLVILFQLTLASNVFTDPASMPVWLQQFIRINPIARLVSAVRGLASGAPNSDIAWVLLASAALVAVFAPLTLRAYSRGT